MLPELQIEHQVETPKTQFVYECPTLSVEMLCLEKSSLCYSVFHEGLSMSHSLRKVIELHLEQSMT